MSSKRLTQAEANYKSGDPISNCGICSSYQGAVTKRCTQVMGDISPFGVCNVMKVAPNPFGSMLSPNEKQAIKMMAADAQDRSQGGGAPPMQGAPMQQQQGPPMPRPPM
jgi:hypothetical protein